MRRLRDGGGDRNNQKDPPQGAVVERGPLGPREAAGSWPLSERCVALSFFILSFMLSSFFFHILHALFSHFLFFQTSPEHQALMFPATAGYHSRLSHGVLLPQQP